MKQKLELKIQHKLNMTPQLQQAIRLLQLSSQELEVEIQAMLEANPLLELDNSDDLQEKTLEMQVFETAIRPENENYENQEYARAEETSLQQHLLWQINFSAFSKQERLIANILIDAISDDGYLGCQLTEIQDTLHTQESCEFAMTDIETVLFKIQQFEPLGVAARHLSECLTIQLNNFPQQTPYLKEAKELVTSHLPLLGLKNYSTLSKKLNLSQKNLKRVIQLVTKLDPKPGRQISLSKRSECIIPDLLLRKKKEGFVVELNMDVIPKLRINSDYSILSKSVDTEEKALFYRQHLKEAEGLIKSLKNRYSTLLKVANCIVQKQSSFLLHGVEFMQGLSLQDVAQITNLHESTISRITTNKYLHTHRGCFELKHFFSTQIQTQNGESHSATAIRSMIKKLIQAESHLTPLSDEQIREILLSKNISLSRRTISKYREAMNIQSSTKRHWTQSLH